MTDILIYGINGKLGREVYLEAVARADVNVVCGVDKHPVGDFNCPIFTNINECVGHFDVIIDFSSPSSLRDILAFATENKCALVLATTGYDELQEKQITEASKTIPICWSSNFSEGINALREILPTLKNALEQFDVSIIEAHKKEKRDKPSGTAISLKKALGKDAQILSVRGGDTPGSHEILFSGKYESLSIKHVAYTRRGFAKGAIDASIKLISKPCGLYDKL